MDHAVLVRIIECARSFTRNLERLIYRELSLAIEPAAEALALDVRHCEPVRGRAPASRNRLDDAGVVYGEDVWMLKSRGHANLALEALRPEARGELGMQYFEGNGSPMAEILGEKHRGHAAAPELPLDRVTVETNPQLLQ